MRGGGDSVHRIQEPTLEAVDLAADYAVHRTLGEGCFAKVLLATHRRTATTVVLKAIHTELTPLKDFYREFHYSYHLSPHPNILTVYSVAFRADDCFVFAQEYSPLGDLSGFVKAGGLPEEHCKNVAAQLASALEFMHSKQLVHRDLKLENVLVFAQDLSKIKLCDFGATRREGTLVNKIRCSWLAFSPPEICEVLSNERYYCKVASDCWQVAILIFLCLTGYPPWQSADNISDPDYGLFSRWQKRRTTKLPPQFRKFSQRLLRMFRRLLEHKPDQRAPITEVNKYLKDSWWNVKMSSIHGAGCGASSSTRKESQYSRPNEDKTPIADESKKGLKQLLSNYSLESTVDQKAMSRRVWEWVLSCESDASVSLEGI